MISSRSAAIVAAERGVEDLLRGIGEDPSRPGLRETPKRVVRAYLEMTGGVDVDVPALLSRSFEVEGTSYDELVVLSGIEFASLCEHHLLPFTGTAAVGYLPGERVVGLSKLARLVDAFARRLQLQERLTAQIAHALIEHGGARAAGVVIRASHACMSCRGVRKPGAAMLTSTLLGEMRESGDLRAEFLRLAGEL